MHGNLPCHAPKCENAAIPGSFDYPHLLSGTSDWMAFHAPNAYIEEIQRGIDYCKPLNSARHLSMSHRYIGLVQLRQGKLDEAEQHFLLSLRYLWRGGRIIWNPLMRLAQVPAR